MDNLSQFVECIREYLVNEDITVNQFARQIGVAERAVAKWMTMDYFPTIDSAIKVAELLDCSLDYLLGMSVSPKINKKVSNNVFLERFERLCELKKVTPYIMAKECKFGQSMISKWYNGKSPKTETLIKLAYFFDCSIDYLIGRSDNP